MPVSRRSFLEGAGSVGVGATGSLVNVQDDGESTDPVSRRALVPRVEEFEDDFVGQWVALNATVDIELEVDIADECDYANWPPDETRAYEAQLLDRRSEEPIAVDILTFTDGTEPDFEVNSVFIINRVHDCTPEHVGVDLVWVPRRSVRGEEPGPTATEPDGIPGMGALGALGALAAVAIARAIRGGRR